MKLVKIAEQPLKGLEDWFEEAEQVPLGQVTPHVEDNQPSIKTYGADAVYARIPKQRAVFGRVMLETLEDQGVALNYSSTAFFTAAKKNYLQHVMHQKGLKTPSSVVIADEKASRNIENHVKGPLIASRYEGMKQVEKRKLSEAEEIRSFAEGTEYSEEVVIYTEYNSGEKYRVLVAGDSIIPLKDDSDTWKFTEDSLKYSGLSTELEEEVKKASERIGINVAEVKLRNGEIVDVEPNPDLGLFMEASGKNAYEKVAETLKEAAE